MLIAATIRGGNQLVPYMNNLCGGVFTVDLPPELYQRWVQFGAFSPVLWFHGLWGLRLPWEYGDAGEATYRKFVGLRYSLLPYIYSYSRVAHDAGLPPVRAMYLDYPDQAPAYANDQQYLFGRELLVAPVTKPGNGRPVLRDVWLPSGDDWFDYFTGAIYEGGRKIVHECPIDRMPLFVRAGSIIPMGPTMDHSDQSPVDPLTVDAYAGRRAAEFNLYEDDGTIAGVPQRGFFADGDHAGAGANRRGPHAHDRSSARRVPRMATAASLRPPHPRTVETGQRSRESGGIASYRTGRVRPGLDLECRLPNNYDSPVARLFHTRASHHRDPGRWDVCRSNDAPEGKQPPRTGAAGQAMDEIEARGAPGRRRSQETAPCDPRDGERRGGN